MLAPTLRTAIQSSLSLPSKSLFLRASLSTATTPPNPPPTFHPANSIHKPNKTETRANPLRPKTSPSSPSQKSPSIPPLPPTTSLQPVSPLALLPSLAAQPPHYIIAHIHARPYLLTAGDTLRLPFHMPDVVPGTMLRLNRASSLGSRDYTFRGQPWIDPRLFVCRARVIGVEGEPIRVVLKTKRRQRHVKRVATKMRFTVLRCLEVTVMDGREVGTGSEPDEDANEVK